MSSTPSVVLTHVHSTVDVTELHRKLRSAFDKGTTNTVAYRQQQLHQLKKMIVDYEPALLETLKLNLGRAAFEGWFADTAIVLHEIDLAIENIDKWLSPKKVSGNMLNLPSSNSIYRDPLGVVLIVAPWNYPVQLLLSPLVGAIAAGNAALLKPSEISVNTSNILARLLPKYMDSTTIALVNGGVKETRDILTLRSDLIFY